MSQSPCSTAAMANDLFDQFMSATTLKGVVTNFRRICKLIDLQPGPFTEFYPAFKKGLAGTHKQTKNWKAQSVFTKIDRRASNRIYHKHHASSSGSNGTSAVSRSGQATHPSHGHHSGYQTQVSQNSGNNILEDHNCLIIGGGPCGLRTAIELQLLGAARVLVIEKRDRFSRNNVLHLWPFVIADLKQMAGKKFYGKFCAGSIDHVSIRQLQLMLMKFALILGVDFMENITFDGICPKNLIPVLNGHVSQNEESARGEGCNGKRKSQFSGSLPTNKEEDEEHLLLSSSDDQLDGNVCGRVWSGSDATTDNSSVSATRSASSSSSTSSLSAPCNAKNGCGNSHRELSGTESENHNLPNHKRHPCNAVIRDEAAASAGCNERASDPPAFSCNTHNHQPCSCCCHLHHHNSQSHWDTDPEDMLYQTGAFAHFSVTSLHPATASPCTDYESMLNRLHGYQFDVVLGADGRRNTLSDHFPRKEFRGRLAIAITANFVNTHTLTEAQIPEISGISFIYNQQLFRTLHEETGIDLENICYYKDDTHYFVMTAKKSSLLARNVLYNDHTDTRALLDPDNINRTELLKYAQDAAKWTTGLKQNFAMNHYGEPDVAMFDFTSMYAAENACRAKKIVNFSQCDSCGQKKESIKRMKVSDNPQVADVNAPSGRMRESLLLFGLVGDSLLEPFWPTGSGCGRGFLSAMDSAWMVRQWAVKDCTSDQEAALSVLKEREAIYRLLGQTKSENLSQNFAAYSLNPISRYPNLNSSTVFPHECRHLLYDDVLPPAAPESVRLRRQSIAAKRARRATIASSSPFSGISEEASPLVAAHQKAAQVREELSAIDQSLEDSFADFENNYQGLIDKSSSSSSTVPSSSLTSSSTLVNSNSSNYRSSAFNEMLLSPSATNLATLGRSRAKDIEAALRHRRQQQLVLNRSDMSSSRSSVTPASDAVTSDVSSQSHSNGTSQQLKSKMSWLLEQKDSSSAPLIARETAAKEKDLVKEAAPFASRVRNLEAKFHANSGLHSIDMTSYEQSDQKKKIISKGSSVMTAASTLEQLLNPHQQEVRLKEKAGDYRKKTHDIKVVMKMTKETDWNKKCWEEREKQAEASKTKKPSVSPTPRPKKMIDIFKGKKDEIANKLHDSDSNQQLIRLTSTKKPKSRKNDDNGWISLIKTELTERSTSPNRQTNKIVAKAPSRSPFLQAEKDDDKKTKFQFIHNHKKNQSDSVYDMSPVGKREQTRVPDSPAPSATPSPRCVRCHEQVASVDRILINDCVLHRSCLNCSRCGVTLRLSEVRSGAGDDFSNFSYLCILCSKNRVNNASTRMAMTRSADQMTTSVDGCLLVTRPPPAPISPNQQRRQAAVAEKSASSFAATDEYELRLRERMKWKEQFLLNNNNIDFAPMVKRQVFKTSSAGFSECNHMSEESTPSDHQSQAEAEAGKAAAAGLLTETTAAASANVTSSTRESAAVPSSSRHKINERIGYENVSNSFELYDDDELTRMLNLETGDQWESGEEEESTSSGSWRRSEDSTDADFDSDEFDLSHASKHAERKRQEANRRKPEAEQEAIVVPEIIVQATDEEAVATSEEIDTAVLDAGFSLHLAESTLEQISETDSRDENSGSAALASPEKEQSDVCSHSESDSGESHTLADVSGKRGLLASFCNDSRSPDSRSTARDVDDDTTRDTSVSSLSCCDVSGTFEDLNLLSLLQEEEADEGTTARGSECIDEAGPRKQRGLSRGSPPRSPAASFPLTSNSITSVASSMQTTDVTPAAPASVRLTPTNNKINNQNTHCNRSNAGSAETSTASSSYTLRREQSSECDTSSAARPFMYSTTTELLMHGNNLSSSAASNPNSLSSKCTTTTSNINSNSSAGGSGNGMSMRATSFKVAQPKFTVFNFDLQSPAAEAIGCKSTRTPASVTCDARSEQSVNKSSPFVSSRSVTLGGGPAASGPPTGGDQETYSKIPVLATRVNESNGSPKAGKPSYSGSFTEKLMLRCRSSPTLLHDKENMKSADGGNGCATASGTGAAQYQSVLAKWACKNLYTMDRSSSPATFSVMDLLSRTRSNDTSSSSVNSADHADQAH